MLSPLSDVAANITMAYCDAVGRGHPLHQFLNPLGGELVKGGTDTLLLNGDSSGFTGTTQVAGGKLIVGDVNSSSAILGGNISVLSGATLGCFGSVGETTVQSGGILSPGNSIGILTVDGNLTLTPGSILEIEIAANGPLNRRSDIVGVTGLATISGSTVSITAIDPKASYQSGQNYTIMHADGGVSGTFDTVVSKSAFLNLTVNYSSKDVLLNIAIKEDPAEPSNPGTPEPEKPTPPLFTTVGETRNQLATARGLDTLAQTGSSLALYNSLLMLSADEARAAFDNLSGEAYASTKGALINDSQFVRNAALGRLQQAFGGAPAVSINALSYAPSQKAGSAPASAVDAVAPASIASAQNLYTAWGYAYGAWARQDGDGNAGDTKSSIGGFVTGIDGTVLDTWRLGLLSGYSHSSFNMDERSSSGSSDNYTLGAYAGTEWNFDNGHALAFRSGLAYTWHNIDMDRSVTFPGFTDRLNADYDAGTFQLFGELGYKLRYDKALFEPYTNLAYVRLKTDGFGEEGLTAAALSVNSDTTDTSFSTLGLRASTEFTLGTIATKARADLGWRHAYGDITPVSTASFIGSDAFTVWGLPIAEDAALLEAGLDFRLTEDATLDLSYNGQFTSGAKQNGFNAKLSVGF
ncbi:autotransporter outer membrane beta-barrel domain-containing protein [Ochrobactrum sp. POC9]|nr:autotransporter outer membrane beta-barrel domain-containing protein [Ochrobactrum sp. POC9]